MKCSQCQYYRRSCTVCLSSLYNVTPSLHVQGIWRFLSSMIIWHKSKRSLSHTILSANVHSSTRAATSSADTGQSSSSAPYSSGKKNNVIGRPAGTTVLCEGRIRWSLHTFTRSSRSRCKWSNNKQYLYMTVAKMKATSSYTDSVFDDILWVSTGFSHVSNNI